MVVPRSADVQDHSGAYASRDRWPPSRSWLGRVAAVTASWRAAADAGSGSGWGMGARWAIFPRVDSPTSDEEFAELDAALAEACGWRRHALRIGCGPTAPHEAERWDGALRPRPTRRHRRRGALLSAGRGRRRAVRHRFPPRQPWLRRRRGNHPAHRSDVRSGSRISLAGVRLGGSRRVYERAGHRRQTLPYLSQSRSSNP